MVDSDAAFASHRGPLTAVSRNQRTSALEVCAKMSLVQQTVSLLMFGTSRDDWLDSCSGFAASLGHSPSLSSLQRRFHPGRYIHQGRRQFVEYVGALKSKRRPGPGSHTAQDPLSASPPPPPSECLDHAHGWSKHGPLCMILIQMYIRHLLHMTNSLWGGGMKAFIATTVLRLPQVSIRAPHCNPEAIDQ